MKKHTLGGVVEPDLLDGIANNVLVVHIGLGGDLTKDHDQTGLGSSLCIDRRINV